MKKKQNGATMVNAPEMNTRMLASIKPGLFPSERTVQFRNADGEEIAIFVSLGQVDEVDNTVRVTILEQNQHHVLVQVPAHGGSTVAKVSKEGIRLS
jgi:O-glycosyl hydrolase